MIDTAQFLKSILPTLHEGEIYVGVSLPAGGGGMRQEHFDSIEKLTAWLQSESDSKCSAYMALATYTPHQNKKGTGPGRQGEYAKKVQSFWIDIDCGEKKAVEGKGYATQKDALTALGGFCKPNGLPIPTIVNSGGGWHCYWLLTEPIDASEWGETANKLHELNIKIGLIADASRTHDVASILRPVGTLNYKYNPRMMVELKYASEPIEHDAFKAMVDSALARPKTDVTLTPVLSFPNPTSTSPDLSLNDEVAASLQSEYPRADATMILERCAAVSWAVSNQGNVDEPYWRSIIGIAKFCADGDEAAHRWSNQHPKYNQGETQAKLDNWKGTGATLCTTLADHKAEVCATCPHKSKINSPIVLGYPEGVSTEGTPELQATDPVLLAIQDRFALIVLKKIGVVDRAALTVRGHDEMAAPLTVFSREDGALLIRRLIQSEFSSDRVDRKNQFFYHPNTICYRGIEFNPKNTSTEFLNLWIGPTSIPAQGDWKIIQEFLLNVICSGSEAANFYLIRYIAHALQRPWEKPGTMIAMVGGEGIGKGTLARIIRKIWTATFLHTHAIKPIVGDFNESLERVFWVFLDEAIFSGDHAGTNALKALITEPTIHINPKNQSPRTIRSYHRFIAATNAEHFKHVDPDNRRDFMLKVSEHRKGDKEYWDALSKAIDGGEVVAMMFDLLKIDLSGFDIRTKPNTKELTQQKLQSLPHFERWWFDCLSRGCFSEHDNDWPEFVSTQILVSDFKAATQGVRVYKQLIDRDIKDKVRKVCPSAKDVQRMEHNNRRRGLNMPTLEIARVEFEKYIGDVVEWE